MSFQKKMMRLLSQLAVVATVAGGSISFPATPRAEAKENEKLGVQKAAEERVLHIIHGYDPDALVFVDVVSKTSDGEKLPSTPFTVEKLALPDGADNTAVESLKVTILSKKPKLPKKVETLIHDSLRQFSDNIDLKVKGLPAELIPELAKDQAAEEEAKKHAEDEQKKAVEEQKRKAEENSKNPLAATEKLIGEVRDAISHLGKSTDTAADAVKSATEGISSDKTKKIAALVLGGFGLYLLVLFLLSALFSSRRSRAIETALTSSLSDAVAKITSASKEGGDSRDADAGAGATSIGGIFEGALAQEDGHGGVAAMNDDSIIAMLCDCYWSKQDGYAALLWRKVPMGRRTTMMAVEPRLKDYIAYLGTASNLIVLDLHAEHDPYYLMPLPLNHLDNHALAEAAKSIAGLFGHLPPMRTDAMALSAHERMALLADAGGQDSKGLAEALKALPDSAPRHLLKIVQIPISSVEEEADILASSSSFSLDKKRSLRTLGWLTELSQAEGAAILKPHSAKALAGVWVGPASTLEKLATFLPSEKMTLLSSYLEKTPASRDGALFRALHEASIKALAALETSVSKSPSAASPVKEEKT